MFHFDGGTPPWTSGLSQGTALQVLARAWSRFQEPAYLTAAQQALGIFQTPPPQGVRVSTPAGAMYAEYTYAPNDRILNGFIQALVGPLRLHGHHQGPARASAVRSRRRRGARDRAAATTPARGRCTTSSANPTSTTTNCSPNSSSTCANAPAKGRRSRPRALRREHAADDTAHARAEHRRRRRRHQRRRAHALAQTSSRGVQIPGDQIYCTTAQRFTADLHTPPAISLLSKTLPGGARAGVQISLSKISTVSLTVRQGSRVVWTNSATRRTRQAAAAVDHPGQGRDLLGHAHRDRPRGQLLHGERHDRRHAATSLRAPRLD